MGGVVAPVLSISYYYHDETIDANVDIESDNSVFQDSNSTGVIHCDETIDMVINRTDDNVIASSFEDNASILNSANNEDRHSTSIGEGMAVQADCEETPDSSVHVIDEETPFVVPKAVGVYSAIPDVVNAPIT